jgi:hypothetical protein
VNEPDELSDDDSLLSLEDGLYFDIDTEGPDLINWNDGLPAAKDSQ